MDKLTTPTHNFIFSVDPEQFDVIQITYKQNGNILAVKSKSDLTFSESGTQYKASLTLSQEETALFDACRPAFVQIRVKSGSTVMAAQINMVSVNPSLNEEVI